jgi:hypothetical protein
MEKHISKISIATLIFVIICFFQTCGSKGKTIDNKKGIQHLQMKVDSLTKVLSDKPSAEQVNYEMVQTMYKFLIYEEDLDKGRISLSEIKNRIDE